MRLYWTLEAAGLAVLGNRIFASILTGMAERNIARSIRDADLRRRLTPNYKIGCKRILVSDDYYPAFTRDNVELITDPIAGFAARGLSPRAAGRSRSMSQFWPQGSVSPIPRACRELSDCAGRRCRSCDG